MRGHTVPRFQWLCYADCQRQSSFPSGSLKYESSPPGSDLIGLVATPLDSNSRVAWRISVTPRLKRALPLPGSTLSLADIGDAKAQAGIAIARQHVARRIGNEFEEHPILRATCCLAM